MMMVMCYSFGPDGKLFSRHLCSPVKSIWKKVFRFAGFKFAASAPRMVVVVVDDGYNMTPGNIVMIARGEGWEARNQGTMFVWQAYCTSLWMNGADIWQNEMFGWRKGECVCSLSSFVLLTLACHTLAKKNWTNRIPNRMPWRTFPVNLMWALHSKPKEEKWGESFDKFELARSLFPSLSNLLKVNYKPEGKTDSLTFHTEHSKGDGSVLCCCLVRCRLTRKHHSCGPSFMVSADRKFALLIFTFARNLHLQTIYFGKVLLTIGHPWAWVL